MILCSNPKPPCFSYFCTCFIDKVQPLTFAASHPNILLLLLVLTPHIPIPVSLLPTLPHTLETTPAPLPALFVSHLLCPPKAEPGCFLKMHLEVFPPALSAGLLCFSCITDSSTLYYELTEEKGLCCVVVLFYPTDLLALQLMLFQ